MLLDATHGLLIPGLVKSHNGQCMLSQRHGPGHKPAIQAGLASLVGTAQAQEDIRTDETIIRTVGLAAQS